MNDRRLLDSQRHPCRSTSLLGFVQARCCRETARGILLALTLGAVLTLTACARADAPQDVWIISTRRAPGCGTADMEQADLEYRQCQEGTWVSSTAEAFRQSDAPDVPTVFFIHGYQVDACAAAREGWALGRALRHMEPERPARVVIWSWPATRGPGRLRHAVQQKAARSDAESYYLARCIDRMDPRVPTSAIGHSFGARVITGALEMLAGGEVAGRQLPEGPRPARRLRAVLVAAAMDNASLLPGRRNDQALLSADRVLITQNGRDRVLKWYPRMYGRGGPDALGYTGPACPARLGELQEKIEVLGLSCSVGKTHAWTHYLASPVLRARFPEYALFAEPETAAQDTAAP